MHLQIFPHSQQEFPSMEILMMWMLNGLRGRAGVYYFRDASAIRDLPRGSVVLFRWQRIIVGEAVVWKEKEVFRDQLREKTLQGQDVGYTAQVTFAPSSIRLYSPPLPVEFIQQQIGQGKDIMSYSGAYIELDWSLYARILAEVVLRGTFVS
jgi:hypothetical protein